MAVLQDARILLQKYLGGPAGCDCGLRFDQIRSVQEILEIELDGTVSSATVPTAVGTSDTIVHQTVPQVRW